jgi:hypothetical protein
MPGWELEVYVRAEKLFRRLSEDEVKTYTANWPECPESLADEKTEAEQVIVTEAYDQWIANLWRLLFRILTSLIIFNVGLVVGFWLLVYFDKAKPHEALVYSLVFGLLAIGLVVVDFIIFHLYRDAKERFGPPALTNS